MVVSDDDFHGAASCPFCRGWNDDGHASSVPGGAGDVHLAAEQQRALVHAEQSERLPAVQVAVGDADAVVLHLHPAPTRVARPSRSMSTRVAREWRATLVRISWKMRNDRGRDVDVGLHRFGRQLGAAADAGALLEFLRLPADRGDQAHVVEHLGAQAGGDLAHRLHGRVDQLATSNRSSRGAAGPSGASRARPLPS